MRKTLLLLCMLTMGVSCLSGSKVDIKTPYDTGRKIGLTYLIVSDINAEKGYKYVSQEKTIAVKEAYRAFDRYLNKPSPGDTKTLIMTELRKETSKPGLLAAADIVISESWRKIDDRYKIDARDYWEKLKLLKEIMRGINSALADYPKLE